MQKIFAFAIAAAMALSAPALAQQIGSPGAAPSGSGSNTPGSGQVPNKTYNDPHNNTNGMSEGRAAAPDDSSSRNNDTTPGIDNPSPSRNNGQ